MAFNGGGPKPESEASIEANRVGNVLNPCPQHPSNEISFLDKSRKMGVCSECVALSSSSSSELIPLTQTISEVQEVLLNLEANMLDLLRERTGQLSENKNKIQVIEGDKISFLTDQ